jgi:fibronectin type 3 domain-containing protein
VRVQARNGELVTSSTGPEAALFTLSEEPAAGVFSDVSTGTVRANWTGGANSAVTEYLAENRTRSTDSGWTVNTTWLEDGLTPNTSYQYRVKGRNGDGVETSTVTLGWACTYATVPSTPSVSTGYNGTDSYYTDIVIAGTDGNPVYTEYAIWGGNDEEGYGWLQVTGSTGTVAVWQTQAVWGVCRHRGLSDSTTYYYRVRAQNIKGTETVDSGWANIKTLPPKVTNVVVTEIEDDRLNISWSAADNTLYYRIYVASAATAEFVELDTTTALSFEDDMDGEEPGAASGVTVSTVSTTSLLIAWTPDTDPLNNSATRYYQITAVVPEGEGPASDTREGSVSPVVKGYNIYKYGSLFATNLGAGSTEYTDTTLLPNTSGSYQIAVLSSDDLEGVRAAPLTKWTYANVPDSPTVSGDWDITNRTHADITIEPNGNSANTEYAVTIDSGVYGIWWLQADHRLDTTPYWTSDLNWMHSRLLSLTSYYYKVKARNADGWETGLSEEGLVFTPPLPGPKGFTVQSKAVDAVTWGWYDLDDTETGYRVYSSTGGQMSGDLPANATEWQETGLSSNTYYARYVKSVYAGNEESLKSNTTACYTLLGDPYAVAVYMVGTTSITVSCPYTIPNISSGMTGAYFMNVTRTDISSWIHQDSWTSAGLAVNTRYGFTERMRNGDGVLTKDTVVRYVYTRANTPAAPSFIKVRDITMDIRINENGNPEETEFAVRVTTPGGIDCYAQLMGTYSVIGAAPAYHVKSAWGASCHLEGLSPVTTYYIAVKARNGDGIETEYSAISIAMTKGREPLLSCEWDTVNQYHVHITVQPAGNPANILYAIVCINSGLWLDGNGSVGTSPVYLTKAQWEFIPHRNAQIELQPGNKYWYRVRAKDPTTGSMVDSAESAIYVLAPPSVTVSEQNHDVAGLKWAPVAAAQTYSIYYATATAGQLYFLDNVTDTGYGDDIDGGEPDMVTGLNATTQSSSTVSLSWAAPADPVSGDIRYYRVAGVAEGQEGIMSSTSSCTVSPVIKGYRIYRNGVFVATVSSATVTYMDTGLSPETRYNYRVSAVSSDDLEGLKSDQASAETFPSNMPLPEEVMGLRIVAQDGTTVRIRFLAIRRRANGSSIDGYLRCYSVYRSGAMNGVWEKIVTILPGNDTEFADTYNGELCYYRVKAVDIYEQESEGLMTVNTMQQVYVQSSDRKAAIMFDDGAKDKYLYEGEGKRIKIMKDESASGETRTCYTVAAYDPDGNRLEGESIKGSRLGAQLVFYFEAGTNASNAFGRNMLEPTLYWHNSVKWVRVNGEVDPYVRSITLRTKTLGQFAIQYEERAESFKMTSVEPKIFSPDEANNAISRTRFYFENPNYSEVTSVIFDLRGNVVRKNLPREMETVLYWDGRDTSGTVVPSGVYLYQIEADGKVVNGTIVVAK